MLRTLLLASKHAQLHAKYDHLLDFDDTLSVISLCWRYFNVYTLFPFYFTRRVLSTPVSSSKEADLCEKCDHLLDFEENSALYRSCWRYFNVKSLFPSHFTRRLLRTSLLASKHAQLHAKYDHLLDFATH